MTGSRKWRDWGLLLLCNLIWASQFVMVKLVQEQMGPLFAVCFPMLISTLLLMPLVYRRKHSAVTRADVWRLIALGLFGQVVAQLFVTWGLRYSLASNAALLMLALPVCTALMAKAFLGEHMTRIRWLSFGAAIIGFLLCSDIDWKSLDLLSGKFLLGNLLIFLSVNGSAFYNAYSKTVLDRRGPLEVLLYSYYAVMAVMIPLTLLLEPAGFARLGEYSGKVWFGLFILAALQYFLSMVIFLDVLTRLDAIQAAVCNYLIPFFGLVIAWIGLSERLTWPMAAGGALGVASTLMVTVWDDPA